MYSDDEGTTWSAPVDITASVKPAGAYALDAGPGNGFISLRYAPSGYGRLLATLNYSLDSPTTAKYGIGVYSDDNGITWTAGGALTNNTTAQKSAESQLAELSDGTIYCSVRNQGNTPNRAIVKSTDHGVTWGSYENFTAFTDPTVTIGLLSVGNPATSNNHKLLVRTWPNDSSQRINLTLAFSTDDGVTWNTVTDPSGNYPGGTQIRTGAAEYSAIAEMPGGDLLVAANLGTGTLTSPPGGYQSLAIVRLDRATWAGIVAPTPTGTSAGYSGFIDFLGSSHGLTNSFGSGGLQG